MKTVFQPWQKYNLASKRRKRVTLGVQDPQQKERRGSYQPNNGNPNPNAHPSTETLKNKQKLSEPILSELWKIKVHKQPSKHWIFKKRKLKNVKKALCFYPPLPHPSPAHWWSWRWHPAFPVWDPGPWFQRWQSRPYRLLCGSVLTHLGATWRTDTRF